MPATARTVRVTAATRTCFMQGALGRMRERIMARRRHREATAGTRSCNGFVADRLDAELRDGLIGLVCTRGTIPQEEALFRWPHVANPKRHHLRRHGCDRQIAAVGRPARAAISTAA